MFEDYLSEHFSINRVSGGRELLIMDDCPFCGGYGKIYVNPSKNRGICHKCGVGFGPERLVMAHQGVSFNKAKEILASGDSFQRLEGNELPEELKNWYPPPGSLAGDPIEYLKGRGITNSMISENGIYYCDQNVKLGETTYWTSGRVIIPIYNKSGEAVSWQGRDITGSSKIKYLFPPGFKGAENLYNIHRVKAQSMLIVCEGVFDVFGWMKVGTSNVVATFGKKLSDYQRELLVELEPTFLMLAWDSDAAAEKFEFVETYGHLFKNIRLVDLCGSDADELDGFTLLKALGNAKPYSWEEKILSGLNQ